MVMGDTESLRPSLNPLLLQLQKMELELKCLKCLEMLRSPILMPCDHIFCCYCIATFTETLKCPVCMLHCFHKDARPASHIEKMISIHKSMSAILDSNLSQRGPSVETFDTKISSSEGPVCGSRNAEVKSQEDLITKISGKKSSTAPCVPLSGNLNDANALDEVKIPGHVILDSKKHTDSTKEEAFTDHRESYSPPSFGNIKDSDHDSNDQSSELRTKTSAAKRLSKEGLKDETRDAKEGDVTKSKRQKTISEPDVRDTENGVNYKDSMKADSKSENNREDNSSTYQVGTSEHPATNTLVECAFCHSFRTTEGSGQMLHYLNGKPIEGDQVSQPKAVHVHQKCIDWAPQVYFRGETAFNLKGELLRASKIKCSHCGLKGAALGCYIESCRKSYHVPCAYEIPECSWDCENFLVLCPAHSECKLPCDKSKKKKKNNANDSLGSSDISGEPEEPMSATTQDCDAQWTSSPGASRQWLFCRSSLSKEEKVILDKFARLTGAEVTSSWKQNVTHVIASTDEHGACSRTLKFLMAILSGKWILTIDWIKACMEAGHPVAEEPYEISHDVHGCFDGPKIGRIRAAEKAPELFAGLSFYFSGDFDPSYKGHLEKLVKAAGGALKKNNDFLLSQNSKPMENPAFVVFSADPPEDCNFEGLNDIITMRRKEAESFAAQSGSRAIAHTWLLDSIAACNLQMGSLR